MNDDNDDDGGEKKKRHARVTSSTGLIYFFVQLIPREGEVIDKRYLRDRMLFTVAVI